MENLLNGTPAERGRGGCGAEVRGVRVHQVRRPEPQPEPRVRLLLRQNAGGQGMDHATTYIPEMAAVTV